MIHEEYKMPLDSFVEEKSLASKEEPIEIINHRTKEIFDNQKEITKYLMKYNRENNLFSKEPAQEVINSIIEEWSKAVHLDTERRTVDLDTAFSLIPLVDDLEENNEIKLSEMQKYTIERIKEAIEDKLQNDIDYEKNIILSIAMEQPLLAATNEYSTEQLFDKMASMVDEIKIIDSLEIKEDREEAMLNVVRDNLQEFIEESLKKETKIPEEDKEKIIEFTKYFNTNYDYDRLPSIEHSDQSK